MRALVIRSVLALSIAVPAIGCSLTEPYQRVGTWRPLNVNEANLASAVADPHDLMEGKSTTMFDGTTAALAIDRLHHDNIKQLIDTSFEAGSSASSSAAPQGGSPQSGSGLN